MGPAASALRPFRYILIFIELETLVVVKKGIDILWVDVGLWVCTTKKVVQGVSNDNVSFKIP